MHYTSCLWGASTAIYWALFATTCATTMGLDDQKKPQERLGVLWESLQDAYKTLQSKTRLTNLRLSMFTDPKHPHSAYPTLNIKGSESKHLLPALLLVCQSMLNPGIFHERCMLECMEHLQKVVDIYDEEDIVLTIEKWTEVFTLAKGFLDTYSILNQWGEEEQVSESKEHLVLL